MSYPLSDDDSTDSESGIRFKTESTRKSHNEFSFKNNGKVATKRKSIEDRYHDSRRLSSTSRPERRHRDRSKDRRERHRRSRSRSRERRKREHREPEKSSSSINKVSRASSSESSKHEKDYKKNYTSIEENKNKNLIINKNVSSTYNPKKEKEIKENISENESESSFGPNLPPSTSKINTQKSSNVPDLYLPKLPVKRNETKSEDTDINTYGPVLPPKLAKSTEPEIEKKHEIQTSSNNIINANETDGNKSDDSSSFGPALPPHLQKQHSSDKKSIVDTEERNVMGPSIPTHLRDQLQNVDFTENNIILQISDSEDDMIGPVPEGHKSNNISHKLLEERALEMKINSLNPSDSQEPVREEWMTQLPAVRIANLGLGPRQFRSKIGPDLSDRSSWTDTPQDKEKKKTKEVVKEDIKEKSKLEHIATRDKQQAEIVKKHKKKKKRDKSLIEIHQEKLKKKEKDSGKSTERRPFDRDVDLKVNRFDEAQKKAILKKAQLLDTRFSCGEAKFL